MNTSMHVKFGTTKALSGKLERKVADLKTYKTFVANKSWMLIALP
jgi:hypothetical protein